MHVLFKSLLGARPQPRGPGTHFIDLLTRDEEGGLGDGTDKVLEPAELRGGHVHAHHHRHLRLPATR